MNGSNSYAPFNFLRVLNTGDAAGGSPGAGAADADHEARPPEEIWNFVHKSGLPGVASANGGGEGGAGGSGEGSGNGGGADTADTADMADTGDW